MVVRCFVEGLESKLSFAALKSLAEEEKEEQLLWLSLNCPDVLSLWIRRWCSKYAQRGLLLKGREE